MTPTLLRPAPTHAYFTPTLPSGSVVSHETMTGLHPRRSGCTYTMPQRETVAGEATARSATSKIMFIRPCMAMISPLLRHSFLLSSKTCVAGLSEQVSQNCCTKC